MIDSGMLLTELLLVIDETSGKTGTYMIPFELYILVATVSKLLVQCTYNENKESLKTNKKFVYN